MRNYVIIGGSSGIGQKLVNILEEEGANIIATYNTHTVQDRLNVKYIKFDVKTDTLDIDSFPDDAVYSGNGFSAQPSVIYSAQIDFSSSTKIIPMALVGHGHHSGKNGAIATDVSNLTTALNIVDRIIIDIR